MLRRLRVPRLSTVSCYRYLALPSTSKEADANDLNKTIADGVAHVTATNIYTNERSIVQLKLPKKPMSRKFRREYAIPDQAKSGLLDVLIACDRSPKQLQHEADQLTEKLNQRRFPASTAVVREARNKVKAMLKEKHEGDVMNELLDEKISSRINYKERHEVDKMLKKADFNWKPLMLDSQEAAAAYALSRLAPNYAEIARALDEFEGHDFSPASVLDYGSGIGAAFWAVNERFGPSVKEFCMVDPSPIVTQAAMDIMRDQSGNLSRAMNFRRHLVPSLRTKYDLVIAHRILCEIGSPESRLDLISSLWKRTNRFLVLIDSGKQDAFEALMEARDFLLMSGHRLHLEDTMALLRDHNLLSDYITSVLHDKRVSDLERFAIVRDMVPPEIELPTALQSATVYAPCPHDLGCPMLGRSACTVPLRWRVIRADGKRSRYEQSGTETGKMSFVILEKGSRQGQDTVTRILKARQAHGHITCDVCTAFKGIQRLTVSRRAGVLYQRARTRRDGELFPLEVKTVATESMFDLYKDLDVDNQK
ncbi:hypothetical protein Q1695_010246 [Nippostrongylus brasiliensis]|nr:hypothetical protein Q1695_010246 [Nippostrongylus brasiliensis]